MTPRLLPLAIWMACKASSDDVPTPPAEDTPVAETPAVLGRVTLADGIGRTRVDVPERLAGLAWVQAADATGPVGPAVDVYGVGDPGPEDAPSDTATPDDTEPGGQGGPGGSGGIDEGDVVATGSACAGCSTASPPGGFGWLTLVAAWRGRRRRA